MKRILWVVLACLLLGGCTPMLQRSYATRTAHVQFSDEVENPAILRAETYQGMVSAVLHLVSGGMESGVIRLYNYVSVMGSAASDLDAACLEVTQQDPLGAYAVDYIKYELTQTPAYYQAEVKLVFRRTAEQIGAVVSVTGSSAIAGELREVLRARGDSAVFRISYFTQQDSPQSIRQAVEEAYLALHGDLSGLPQTEVTLYPDTGRQRVAELLFTWPEGENMPPEENSP